MEQSLTLTNESNRSSEHKSKAVHCDCLGGERIQLRTGERNIDAKRGDEEAEGGNVYQRR